MRGAAVRLLLLVIIGVSLRSEAPRGSLQVTARVEGSVLVFLKTDAGDGLSAGGFNSASITLGASGGFPFTVRAIKANSQSQTYAVTAILSRNDPQFTWCVDGVELSADRNTTIASADSYEQNHAHTLVVRGNDLSLSQNPANSITFRISSNN
jgi:hypothetical protein